MASTAPARLAWVEACRGVAATAVVLYHVARHFDKNYGMPSLKAVFQFGHAGVDLFFVISGFIILFVHFDDVGRPERIGRYLARRLTRVLPVYWIAIGLTIALRWAGGHNVPLSDMARAILPLPISTEPLLGVAWTLQYEFVFYAAFGVLILNRIAGIAIMAAWLAAVVIALMGTVEIPLPGAYWGIFNLEFLAGMAVAYRLRQGGLPQFKSVLVAGIALFTLAAVAEDVGWMDGYGAIARIAYGFPASLIVLGGAEASRRSAVRVPAILRTLGSASYSLYLFHFLAIGVAWQFWLATGLNNMVSPTLSFVLFVSGALVVGVAMSRLVEYPLMRLIRDASARFWFRKPATVGPNAQY